MQTVMDLSYGFLPSSDPIPHLPAEFEAWECLAGQLPKLLVSDQLRKSIESLPFFPFAALENTAQFERAMLILSFIGHAYVWGEKEVAKKLPAIIAKPWYEVAQQLGRPPILSYASYALHNWKRINTAKPIALGNIGLLQNFLGGADEEWFILVHVDIEAKAIPAIQSVVLAQEAVNQDDPNVLVHQLETIAKTLNVMCEILDRMPEFCDPYIYYHRVRPYIHGWKNNPALPEGLIYEGVQAYADQPQQFRGETGAQSAIIPVLDAALEISHQDDPLRVYLREMRDYMPPAHRNFLMLVEGQPSIREYVKNTFIAVPALRKFYNDCVQLVERFRKTHLNYAATYIQKQQQQNNANSTAVGTGGTPFMEYLRKHKNETASSLL